ncbi:MAG: hypothetical protein PHE53_11765 [Thermoguttaceae bacterium]|nr:hypothetical protein [Thermoguttaceae bacterium]
MNQILGKRTRIWIIPPLLCILIGLTGIAMAADETSTSSIPNSVAVSPLSGDDASMYAKLDAPILFTKRHSYGGIHIYDVMYKWPPGGGGIYLLENPSAPRNQWKIRPVIDETTPNSCGHGVYSDPELSWDAKKILFCFKGKPDGSTDIWEIGIDGSGLRQITDATLACDAYHGTLSGQHDISPAYLPDGRIILLSTRPSGLVPCNNTGVAILHVMNADGSDMHPISVNNVNEFDPVVLPDGRILFGRWEYIDKSALVVQSLWTINPDGSNETAYFANNMVFPEAILDARPIFTADPQDEKRSTQIVGTLAKHNSVPRGSVAFIDTCRNKNGEQMITNPEHPEAPTTDVGDSCEPWPIDENTILFSGRSAGVSRNTIDMIDRNGRRLTLLSDPDICLHDPMLVKPRPVPTVRIDVVDRSAKTGRFFVQDVYRGLEGVKRGEARWIRVIEETSRVSATPRTPTDYNQTFIISSALAFSVKNYLGVTPVEEDGSAYFEVPSGRAVYLQLLDAQMRQIRTMRTFVQAAPGTTRSCIGCHEPKNDTPTNVHAVAAVMSRDASPLQPENWGDDSPGTGSIDYATEIQPILERRCVECHGGANGIAGGVDLSGSWTKYFNISYENLTSRHETQLTAYWISAIDCMNGTAWKSVPIQSPRSHGTGCAPLAKSLCDDSPDSHRAKGFLDGLTEGERNRILAWMDSNGVYNGTWDYSPAGQATIGWDQTKSELTSLMREHGCTECHHSGDATQLDWFEEDWINLQHPEWSRILRAPLPEEYSTETMTKYGLGACRNHPVRPEHRRVMQLWSGYYHGVLPIDQVPKKPRWQADLSGEPYSAFTSTDAPAYQQMLAVIRRGRELALATPRVDMPGAEIIPGAARCFIPPTLPEITPVPVATVYDGTVLLTWTASVKTIGLRGEIWRTEGERPGFLTGSYMRSAAKPICESTTAQRFLDTQPTAKLTVNTENPVENTELIGQTVRVTYALIFFDPISLQRSTPSYVTVEIPSPVAPDVPQGVQAKGLWHSVRISWEPVSGRGVTYRVRRVPPVDVDKNTDSDIATTAELVDEGSDSKANATENAVSELLTELSWVDADLSDGQTYRYQVTAVRRGVESARSAVVTAIPSAEERPVFTTESTMFDFRDSAGRLDSETIPYEGAFAVRPMTIQCRVRFETRPSGEMPVFLGCGVWNQSGWFLQWLGDQFRFHCGKLDCDGGVPVMGEWIELTATVERESNGYGRLRLYQNGKLIAEKSGVISDTPSGVPLIIGQYGGGPAPAYQLHGEIEKVQIWERPLDASEIRPPKTNLSK